MTPVVKVSAAQVLALAAIGVVVGEWLKRRLPVLERLSIPASIAGGLLYAAVILLLHGRVLDLQPDVVVRDLLMLVCFTIIGLNASFRVLRRGGVQVILLLALASLGAVLQNLLGMGLASLLGLDPRTGILAGAVSLAGGPATSLAFGATFERAGMPSATTIALASATFGITVSGLLAGSVGSWLIQRFGLKPSTAPTAETQREIGDPASLMTHVVVIAVSIGLGSLVSLGIERIGFVLPGYIGAMIVAAFFRNVDDRWRTFQISETKLSELFVVALPLFIVMAMLTLRLWELAALAGPLLIILCAQVALTWALSITIAFVAMRRDFDAAVIATGYCGFMLGITANALATMGEVSRRYGPSPRAFIVVPMVGAFLIDFTNALIITVMSNLVSR